MFDPRSLSNISCRSTSTVPIQQNGKISFTFQIITNNHSYCVVSSLLNIPTSPLAASPSVKEHRPLRTCTQEPKAGGKSGATKVKHHSPGTQHLMFLQEMHFYVMLNILKVHYPSEKKILKCI